MTFYTLEQIETKYTNKKKDCQRRNIKFEFTKEEFISFCKYLDVNSNCAYTGVKMNKDPIGNGASIERTDPMKGYSVSNCIWVTHKANQLKGRFDTKNKELKASFTKAELEILGQILKTDIKQKCAEIYKFVKGEIILETKEEIKNTGPVSNVVNITEDFNLAERYVGFVKVCKDFVDVELSFSEFKTMMKRKCCQLSGKVFEEQKHKFLWVIDKTKTVNKSNILIVDHLLSLHIDSMIAKSKLDNKQLKKVFTNLGKVL